MGAEEGQLESLCSPGFLLDFVSCPVIKGFTSAAAITIGFGQIKVGAVPTGLALCRLPASQ